MLERIKNFLFGKDRNPLDPEVFHKISLVAILAWVGLGADGLTSSCYGPEESFLALGRHPYLAIYLAAATALTVLVISTNFVQVIELFPWGGGAYLVVSRLLGPYLGVVTGAALIVDYVLTISVSIASGVDAFYSFLPVEYQVYKFLTILVVLGGLMYLNLRGVKESVQFLMPIFFIFLVTHIVVILYPLFFHASQINTLATGIVTQTRDSYRELGGFAFFFILFRAYSLGGGTYTGIEAVSNAVPVFKEPRIQTGKKTMAYLAASLAIAAGGIIVAYLLMGVAKEPGRTLNASLIYRIASEWHFSGFDLGKGFAVVTLLSESFLLFVAAQSGFIAGPRVLASMGADNWLPHQFTNLSGRLVTQNGVFLITAAATGILLISGGRVSHLVVLYSINVFLVFTLALIGLTRHWWTQRKKEAAWIRRLSLSAFGVLLTSIILVGTVVIKFMEGGWLTLLITSSLVAACFVVRRHYSQVKTLLRKLDRSMDGVIASIPEKKGKKPSKHPELPTAALMVSDFNGLGVHSFMSILKLFPKQFKNVIFLAVGRVDTTQFRSDETVEELRFKVQEDLYQYVKLAHKFGLYAEYRHALGTDTVEELERMCGEVSKEFPNTLFFAGKLSFKKEEPWTRILHNQSALELQRKLVFDGRSMIILPIRVY